MPLLCVHQMQAGLIISCFMLHFHKSPMDYKIVNKSHVHGITFSNWSEDNSSALVLCSKYCWGCHTQHILYSVTKEELPLFCSVPHIFMDCWSSFLTFNAAQHFFHSVSFFGWRFWFVDCTLKVIGTRLPFFGWHQRSRYVLKPTQLYYFYFSCLFILLLIFYPPLCLLL